MQQVGVLLLNIGTPNHCDTASVRRYLNEFLTDPRVIALPALIRLPLVKLGITPLRARQSAAAYQKIWTKAGSPLLVNSQKLQAALTLVLGNQYQIEIGMRYSNPSIAAALEKLAHCTKLIVIPLFPQYSSAATGSALAAVMAIVNKQWNIPALEILDNFYADPGFIQAYAAQIQAYLPPSPPDLFLFSYHGLPEYHLTKSNCQANCDKITACPAVATNNAFCYRAHCFATSRLLAQALHLAPAQYQVSFQSRLGRTPWIKPYTDLLLPELIQQGIKNIAVACPSFVADCLETLEEVNIRLRAQWQSLGGNTFTFIPCLNDQPIWVQTLASHIKKMV
jgi:ferrochelatase